MLMRASQAITNQTGATIKGVRLVSKRLKKADSFVNKSLNTAVRIEGFRLKNLLQKEIKQGRAGGQVFKPLSYIARRLARKVQGPGNSGIRQRPNRKALDRLAHGIRYHLNKRPPYGDMKIGFVGPMTKSQAIYDMDHGNALSRGANHEKLSSKRWRALAKIHQDGFTRTISREDRRYLARRGAGLGIAEGEGTPFFLRKATKLFTTPARPIINPFWRAHRAEANRNIDKNFKKKLKGIRI